MVESLRKKKYADTKEQNHQVTFEDMEPLSEGKLTSRNNESMTLDNNQTKTLLARRQARNNDETPTGEKRPPFLERTQTNKLEESESSEVKDPNPDFINILKTQNLPRKTKTDNTVRSS
jgi:hypothetical protein